jgi:hypothetical protein
LFKIAMDDCRRRRVAHGRRPRVRIIDNWSSQGNGMKRVEMKRNWMDVIVFCYCFIKYNPNKAWIKKIAHLLGNDGTVWAYAWCRQKYVHLSSIYSQNIRFFSGGPEVFSQDRGVSTQNHCSLGVGNLTNSSFPRFGILLFSLFSLFLFHFAKIFVFYCYFLFLNK